MALKDEVGLCFFNGRDSTVYLHLAIKVLEVSLHCVERDMK
jgi:hypothetical protein